MAVHMGLDLSNRNVNGNAEMNSMYDQLISLMKNGSYQARSQEQIAQQALGEYQHLYDPMRLSAAQGYARNDLALQQQRASLQGVYDKQREASAKQYRSAYSQLDRGMIGRGMQRSSYLAQSLANLEQQGAEAQQDIWDQQAAETGNIDQQRSQLAQQLSDTLAQYDTSQAQAVLARIQALQDQDYERGVAAQKTAWDQLVQAMQLRQSLGLGGNSASIGGGGGSGSSMRDDSLQPLAERLAQYGIKPGNTNGLGGAIDLSWMNSMPTTNSAPTHGELTDKTKKMLNSMLGK